MMWKFPSTLKKQYYKTFFVFLCVSQPITIKIITILKRLSFGSYTLCSTFLFLSILISNETISSCSFYLFNTNLSNIIAVIIFPFCWKKTSEHGGKYVQYVLLYSWGLLWRPRIKKVHFKIIIKNNKLLTHTHTKRKTSHRKFSLFFCEFYFFLLIFRTFMRVVEWKKFCLNLLISWVFLQLSFFFRFFLFFSILV